MFYVALNWYHSLDGSPLGNDPPDTGKWNLYQRHESAMCPLTWAEADPEEQKRLISTELKSAPQGSQIAAMELQDITETTA